MTRHLQWVLVSALVALLCECAPGPAPGPLPMLLPVQQGPQGGQGVPQSPCPRVFRYERRGNGWSGLVIVPAPPTGLGLVVRVELSVSAALPTKYAGSLQLQEGRKALLARLADGDRRPVRYTLLFPPGIPLPSLTRVHAMGADLCLAPAARGSSSVTTTINLEHTVRPEPVGTRLLHGNPGPAPAPAPNPGPGQGPDVSTPGGANTNSSSSSSAPAPVEPAMSEDDDEVCGRPVRPTPLVVAGVATAPGDWPWLAAVFSSTSLGLEFHCAGTLVSASHIISAAHCVHLKATDSLLVYVGRHNVRKWTEPQAQARDVERIHVHPDYVPANFTSDLAVLELTDRVSYDWFVRPACIDWGDAADVGLVVGRVGTVVGWGRDERGHRLTPEPRAARLPVVSQETCLRSRPEFVHVTSERTFCAGFRDGSGPCNGDSGSGLMLRGSAGAGAGDSDSGPWFLRGVVSLSLLDGDRRTCDLEHFVVFTDVAKFRDWLAGLVRTQRRRGPLSHPKQGMASSSGSLGLDENPIWDSDPLPN